MDSVIYEVSIAPIPLQILYYMTVFAFFSGLFFFFTLVIIGSFKASRRQRDYLLSLDEEYQVVIGRYKALGNLSLGECFKKDNAKPYEY